jgi:hypothetical protein
MAIKMAIGIASGKIDISDGAKKGGNVRSRSGQRVLWEADATVAKFDLEFVRIGDGDGSVDSPPDWPFVGASAQPNTAVIDEFACKVTGATKFAGRLADDPGIFKYSVKVTPIAPNPQPPALDPVIIIER